MEKNLDITKPGQSLGPSLAFSRAAYVLARSPPSEHRTLLSERLQHASPSLNRRSTVVICYCLPLNSNIKSTESTGRTVMLFLFLFCFVLLLWCTLFLGVGAYSRWVNTVYIKNHAPKNFYAFLVIFNDPFLNRFKILIFIIKTITVTKFSNLIGYQLP